MARILALVSFKVFPPHMGGQKGVVLFHEHLSKHHEILMLVSKDNTEKIEASFKVIPILFPNKNIFSNLSLIRKITRIIKKEKIDCIITEHSYTGWMAWLLRKKTGIPFIIHSHNIETQRFRQMRKRGWKIYQPYEKWIHSEANHNFFINENDHSKAVRDFGLDPEKCTIVPYGSEIPAIDPGAGQNFRERTGIKSKFIFHFNGTMDYEPNVEAVEKLAKEVSPILKQLKIDATIVITGKRLKQPIINLVNDTGNMVYLDFVNNINEVYQASDLFLNAVTNNSGVKTKVIEALANQCSVVSTVSGATGILPSCYGEKIKLVADNDWRSFSIAISEMAGKQLTTPPAFFQNYSWEKIAADAAQIITNIAGNAGKS
jgi:polysaccharide biosynthesis protein PslH